MLLLRIRDLQSHEIKEDLNGSKHIQSNNRIIKEDLFFDIIKRSYFWIERRAKMVRKHPLNIIMPILKITIILGLIRKTNMIALILRIKVIIRIVFLSDVFLYINHSLHYTLSVEMNYQWSIIQLEQYIFFCYYFGILYKFVMKML